MLVDDDGIWNSAIQSKPVRHGLRVFDGIEREGFGWANVAEKRKQRVGSDIGH